MSTADDPARGAFAVTKSDSTILSAVRAIYVGGTGDVVIETIDRATPVTFVAVPAGTILPVRCRRILNATTATDIVALT